MKLTEQINHLVEIATYNVHRCIGLDGLCHPDRIAAVIKELSVDILGLQEVESCALALDGLNQTEYLARASGFNFVPGPTVVRGNSSFGNALLTRFPVQEVRQIDLSMPGREPRGALDVDLDCYGKIVRVIVTHFGLGPQERKRQVGRLLDILTGNHRRPTILVGDLNEWIPRAYSLRALRDAFSRTPRLRTFPSRLPVLPLDRIFVWPHETLLKVKVHMTRLARIASDHLPIKGFVMLR